MACFPHCCVSKTKVVSILAKPVQLVDGEQLLGLALSALFLYLVDSYMNS
jgi:hypothetical protein